MAPGLGGRALHLFTGRRPSVRQPGSSIPVVYLHGSEAARPRVAWPSLPPRGYLGQLEREFQRRLAAQREFIELDDCIFYHASVLTDGRIVKGPWDLRGTEATYLGGIQLRGRRVLELGPASGHISYYMESEGADVVGFDVGYDVTIDLLPRPGVDPVWARNDAARYVGAVQNSWWYLHRDRGSSVKAVYGRIYELPGDIGTFDVSVFAAILLHLRDPFLALEEAARRTTGQIVVTEPLEDSDVDRPEENIARVAPWGLENHTNWWSHTPGSIKRMLGHLGFSRVATTYHTQKHHLGHELGKPAVDMRMFTIVAERPS